MGTDENKLLYYCKKINILKKNNKTNLVRFIPPLLGVGGCGREEG